jgi:RNA polymerase sigma factor (sigma-70 family)
MREWRDQAALPRQALADPCPAVDAGVAAADPGRQCRPDPGAVPAAQRRRAAAHLGVSEAEVADTQLASQAFQVVSLDAPLGAADDAGTLAELMGAEDPQLDHALDIDSVWKHAAELPPREQHLLMMRFYGNMTQEQIGQKMGISQMHVSRLLSHALRYLRDRITERGEPDRH